MRGFALGVLALTGLYLATTAGAGRLSTALAAPTRWLAEWADPTVPLIPNRGQAGGGGVAPRRAAPHPRSKPPGGAAGHIVGPAGGGP